MFEEEIIGPTCHLLTVLFLQKFLSFFYEEKFLSWKAEVEEEEKKY